MTDINVPLASVDSEQVSPTMGVISPKNSSINSGRKKSRHNRDPSFSYFPGNGWLQVFLKGQLPDGRANMGYCVDSQYFYILGGQDLNKGIFNTLYRINLQTVRDNVRNAGWEEIITRGDLPIRISHCCMFISQSKIFVFGGTIYGDQGQQRTKRDKKSEEISKPLMFNVLNLQTLQWSFWRENDTPDVDDFAHFFDQKRGNLWVFGGYLKGRKSNLFFNINVNSRQVTTFNPDTPPSHPGASKQPSQRTGSRLTFDPDQNCLYLFGGLTSQNSTLNDLWKYSIQLDRWDLINQYGDVPSPRCGHSLQFHCDKLFLFGGLREVTQESNESFKFDINTSTWEQFGENKSTFFSPQMKTSGSFMSHFMNKPSSTSIPKYQETPLSALEMSNSHTALSQKHGGSMTPSNPRIRLNSDYSKLNVNDSAQLSGRYRMNKEQFKVFETARAMSELRHVYTKSCRDIVAGCRKPSNPRPGPIPAPLSLMGIMHRQRLRSAAGTGRRQVSVTRIKVPDESTKNRTPARSTINVKTLLNKNCQIDPSPVNPSSPLPSQFKRSGKKSTIFQHNNEQLQEFDQYGTFNYQRTDGLESPTELKMKKTSLLHKQNRGFDHYFTDMKKRNISKGYQTLQNGFTYSVADKTQTPDVSDNPRRASTVLDSQPDSGTPTAWLKPLDRNPNPRDGHAAVFMYNSWFIFGGDRHRMPFNDLLILPLSAHV